MALHQVEKLQLLDCQGNVIKPLTPVDLTTYQKLSGKSFGVAPSVVGQTITYDLGGWSFPESWSENCGVWDVAGSDMFVGQGTPGGCDLLWVSPTDVATTLTSLDPNGLYWTASGTSVSATAPSLLPGYSTYQVATCKDAVALPPVVAGDCVKAPEMLALTPAGWAPVMERRDIVLYPSGTFAPTVFDSLVILQNDLLVDPPVNCNYARVTLKNMLGAPVTIKGLFDSPGGTGFVLQPVNSLGTPGGESVDLEWVASLGFYIVH